MVRRVLRIIGLIGLGALVGAGLGFYLGWVAWPTQFTDASPAILQTEYRRDYVRMIADAYALDGDLAAAQRRVAALGDAGPDLVFRVAVDAILAEEDEATIRRLATLAADLGYTSPAFDPYLDEGENDGAP
jgi:hypothetical protein